MRELLADAKAKLNQEQPKEAFEFAMAILPQLEADEGALERAVSLAEAKRTVDQSDGLDTTDIEERLRQAEEALGQGASQAIGLADGVVMRSSRRAAMDDVLRAETEKTADEALCRTGDREKWDAMLEEITQAADERSWSHAGMLLERMTSALDKGHDDEATEPTTLWSTSGRCSKSVRSGSIKVTDDDRRACEAAIAEAESMLSVGRIEETLDAIDKADGAMERLRRRI